MRKLLLVVACLFILSACGGSAEPDYTTEEFEKALNNGDDVTGKIVLVKIDDIAPDSAFGFNLQAGEHLNFVSSKNPNLEVGDEFIAEIEEVDHLLGSYIIKYKTK